MLTETEIRQLISETAAAFLDSDAGVRGLVPVHVLNEQAGLIRCIAAGLDLIVDPKDESDGALLEGRISNLVSAARRLNLVGGCIVSREEGTGFSTLQLARLAGPTGKVICLEPASLYRVVIEHNAKQNGLANIHFAARTVGPNQLAISEVNPAKKESTIDELLKDQAIDLIVFPKADVDIMASAFTTLNQQQPVVITGCNLFDIERDGYPFYRFARLLIESGYALCAPDTLTPFDSWEQLIVHSASDRHVVLTALPEAFPAGRGLQACRKHQRELVNSNAPGRQWMKELARLRFRNDEPVIIDGGTNKGQIFGALLALYPTAHAHAFEPQPHAAEQLRATFSHFPRVKINQVALGEFPSQTEFLVNAFDETSSILEASDFDAPLSFVQLREKITVDVVTLDAYAKTLGLEWIDLIKLDLQGFELPALKGAAKLLPNVGMILGEVLFVPMYKGQTNFGELDAYLTAAGFRLYNLFFGATNTMSGQQIAADALWLNERWYPYTRFPEMWERDL
jgi:FkbM family methyltransferase